DRCADQARQPLAGIPHRRADALGLRCQSRLTLRRGGVVRPLTDHPLRAQSNLVKEVRTGTQRIPLRTAPCGNRTRAPLPNTLHDGGIASPCCQACCRAASKLFQQKLRGVSASLSVVVLTPVGVEALLKDLAEGLTLVHAAYVRKGSDREDTRII